MARMLQPVPALRATIAQVLAHPWLTHGMPPELATLNDRLLQVGGLNHETTAAGAHDFQSVA